MRKGNEKNRRMIKDIKREKERRRIEKLIGHKERKGKEKNRRIIKDINMFGLICKYVWFTL